MTLAAPSIPEGLDLVTTPAGVIIRRKWFSWKVIPLLIFTIVWDGFLIFWYSAAFSEKNTPWVAILFPLGHLAVGLGLTYYVVCSFLNTTDILLSPDQISVSTYPVPWIGNRTVSVSEIRDTVIRTRSSNNNGASFVVMYVDGLNKERRLVSGITEWDHAEYIERQARRAAGLPEKE